MDEFKISVLMSVYKSEKADYLDRALKSIYTDQTMKPDEIILVQDGPIGEDLCNIIKKWKAELSDKMIILVNETNIGLTRSLIRGIGSAQGKYIARMDTDDVALPHRFQMQFEYMERHLDIDVLGGAIQEFNSESENLGVRSYPLNNEDSVAYIHKGSPVAHPAAMIRKRMFEEGVMYNSTYRTTQDLALWFDVLASGHKIANLPDIILKFRREKNVYRRRANMVDSKMELNIHLKGIRKLFGFSPIKCIYPLARYSIRLLPNPILKLLYDSNLRRIIMKGSR